MSTATIATKSLPASMHKVWIEAYTAAEAAAEACVPTPMVVGNAKAIVGPGSNEIDYSQKTYYVPSGVCGFASEFDQYAVRANINLARYEPAPP